MSALAIRNRVTDASPRELTFRQDVSGPVGVLPQSSRTLSLSEETAGDSGAAFPVRAESGKRLRMASPAHPSEVSAPFPHVRTKSE